jgi:hypothetical protein
MKLWILKANEDLSGEDDPWDPWYDKSHGFVIRAEDETRAREIAQENGGDESEYGQTPWLQSKLSSCIELMGDGDEGVIIVDFKAG